MQYKKHTKIRVPRTDQSGLKYPKMKTVDISELEEWTPESTVQGWADALLRLKHIYYIRLPAELFMNIFRNPQIPVWIKRKIKLAIAGLPDNIAMIPLNDKFCLACNLECKSATGKFTGRQKTLSKEVPYNVVRTQKEIGELLDSFSKNAENIKKIKNTTIAQFIETDGV